MLPYPLNRLHNRDPLISCGQREKSPHQIEDLCGEIQVPVRGVLTPNLGQRQYVVVDVHHIQVGGFPAEPPAPAFCPELREVVVQETEAGDVEAPF